MHLNYWQFGDYLGIGARHAHKESCLYPPVIVRQVHRQGRAMSPGGPVAQDEVARDALPFEFMLNALRLRGRVRDWDVQRTHGLQ